jgi:4-alpha-glucanotransferase
MPELKTLLLASASKDKWERLGPSRRAGVVVPLFSVYSRTSTGIGEFSDLKLVVDWCVATGNSIIQLLPLAAIGAYFCPYDSLSSFALEPAHISLDALPQARQGPLKEKIASLKKAFPLAASHVDYGVKQEKINILLELFFLTAKTPSEDFETFKRTNAYWLYDYALFMVIKGYQQFRPWYEWDRQYRDRQNDTLSLFKREHAREIEFQMWMQWQAYRQLRDVKKYAAGKKVLLKGDLPILVSRDSSDVWAHPELFKLDFAAGAPPDMYAAKGQRWGMPTYEWPKIAAQDYSYLREKLRYALNFYDILRIDHVVGLFRIWSIPYSDPAQDQGLHGSFDPSGEKLWGPQGTKILSVMLQTTGMLLCAEDLGVIPKVCTDALRDLGIPGNDVQRWVKDWNVRHDFLTPGEYRQLSVAMLSTHDTTNWAAWWENEAGTVDEGQFVRRCFERGISFNLVRDKLFDRARSRHGRLRWREDISSVDILLWNLGKKKEEVGDFVGMYLNSYLEKEKLWKLLGLSGPMREACDSQIAGAAFSITLKSGAVFCIETILDWLYLGGIFEGDPYQYRINTPGTTSPINWSLRLPLPLEELLAHPVCSKIKKLIVASRRI